MMKINEYGIDMNDLTTDQKFKALTLEVTANEYLTPHYHLFCLMWLLTLLVWCFK